MVEILIECVSSVYIHDDVKISGYAMKVQTQKISYLKNTKLVFLHYCFQVYLAHLKELINHQMILNLVTSQVFHQSCYF